MVKLLIFCTICIIFSNSFKNYDRQRSFQIEEGGFNQDQMINGEKRPGCHSEKCHSMNPVIRNAEITEVTTSSIKRIEHLNDSTFRTLSESLGSFNRRTRDVSEKDKCASLGTCRANYGFKYRFCHCDDECILFDDCCHDMKRDKLFRKDPGIIRFMSCVDIEVIYKTIKDGANNGFMMVTQCPTNNTTNDVYKCVNYSQNDIPVTDNTGVVYRNIYCAACHGVDNFVFWGISFAFDTCKFDHLSFNTTYIKESIALLTTAGCRMIFSPPDDYRQQPLIFPRHCIKQKMVYNNSTKCRQFMNPVYITREKVYVRNAFCINSSIESICVRPLDIKAHSEWKLLPMTVLFQLKELKDPTIKENCSTSKRQYQVIYCQTCI